MGKGWGLGMERVEISFTEWPEYQGDSKRYESTAWLRLQNTIWMTELWEILDDAEFRCFIFLLTYTSQRAHKTGTIRVNLERIAQMGKLCEGTLRATLSKLEELGSLTCTPSVRTVHAPGENGATKITKITKITKTAPDEQKQGNEKTEAPSKPTGAPQDFFINLLAEFKARKKLKNVLVPHPTDLNPKELEACAKALGRAGPEEWREAMLRAEESPYLCNEVEEKPFRLTLQKLVANENPGRILSGYYDRFEQGSSAKKIEWEEP